VFLSFFSKGRPHKKKKNPMYSRTHCFRRFVPCFLNKLSSRWNTLIRLSPLASHTDCDDNGYNLTQKRKGKSSASEGKKRTWSKVETHTTHRNNNKRTQCATLALAHRANAPLHERPLSHISISRTRIPTGWRWNKGKPLIDWIASHQPSCLQPVRTPGLFNPVQYRRERTTGIDLDRDLLGSSEQPRCESRAQKA